MTGIYPLMHVILIFYQMELQDSLTSSET